MFNWENIWSGFKNYIWVVLILSVLLGVLIFYFFPDALQDVKDIPLPYSEK